MASFIVIIILASIITILLTLCLAVVKENEMGIRVNLWKPGEEVDPGIYLVFRPFWRIVVFPTTQQSISFAVPTVVTKKGYTESYPDLIEPAEVNVLFTLLYYFQEGSLADTLVNAPGFTEKKMATELIPYTTDVLRTLIGRMPWRLINQERYKFTQLALSRLLPLGSNEKCWSLEEKKMPAKKGEKNASKYFFKDCKPSLTKPDLIKSPFVQFALDKVSLAIDDINFNDEDLQKAISAPEKARLEGNAKRQAAEAESFRLHKEGIGAAQARKEMIEIIKSEKDLEALLTLRELAKGTSNTILYQLPHGLEQKLSGLLGGASPGEFMELLGDKERNFIRNMIQEAIEKFKTASGGE